MISNTIRNRVIAVSTNNHGISYSDDNGHTFTLSNITTGSFDKAIYNNNGIAVTRAIDKGNNNSVEGILYSEDYGVTWDAAIEDGFFSPIIKLQNGMMYATLIETGKTYYSENGNYVIVDGGINHLVYYGQTMAMRIPYYDVYPKREENEKSYNIYGSLCTINDIIVKNINECDLKIGDTFIFKNVGAYSSTEGISLFLSRDLPMVVLHRNNDYKVVRNTLKTSDINYPNY